MHRKISIRHHNRIIRGELAFPRTGRKPWPAVLFVHGRSADRNYPVWLPTLRSQLRRSGFVTLAIDLNGHGRSDGRFEDLTLTKAIEDVEAARTWLIQQPTVRPRSVGAFGHSLGGTAIFAAQARAPIFKVMVLAAPVGDSRFHARRDFPARVLRMWKREGKLCWFAPHDQRTYCLRYGYIRDWQKYDTLRLAADVHQPVILIHGSADRRVLPIESRQLFRRLAEPKELAIIPRANHNFDGSASGRKLQSLALRYFRDSLQPKVGRSVVVFVRHQETILALHRSSRVWFYPGAWAVVGGHLPPGTNPVSHGYTELREETGIRRSEVRLVRVGRRVRLVDPKTQQVWISVPILVELRRRRAPKLDWEHTGFRWIAPSKFPFDQSYVGIRKQFQAIGLV